MRIGIFDSGIGGLTVLKSLIERYPNNEYIYYGDTINIPYGDKSIEKLNELASKDVEFLISKKVDIIIIACGTVSSNCLIYLKNKYNIKIYDIISSTINYLNNSRYNNIGLIATERTINSHIFKNNINKNIYEISTPKLVPLIESNNLNNINEVLDYYLKEYKNKIDALVLGCTHYPIIEYHLNNYFNNKIKLINMGELLNIDVIDSHKNIEIYFSKLDKLVIDNTYSILKDKNEIKFL